MSALQAGTELPPPPPPPPPGPGASLRSARERAGLSVDQVAQALKLAPRQVKALEDEDFAQLPGRTFARGFVRNYARLLKLDSDDLLAQLPDVSRAPALAAPSLQYTGATMGEVPTAKVARSALARWLIPLALVACVVAAGAYEWYRSGRPAPTEATGTPPSPMVQASPPAAGTTRSELPNPLTASAPADSAAAERRESPSASAPAPAPPTEAQTAASTTPPSTATPAPATVPAASPDAPAAAAPAAEAQTAAPIVLTYRAAAWTQVRDGRGQVIFVRVVPAGSEQAIRGTPPFDLVVGNARSVTLVYRGNPIDLARYTQGNVARLRLQ